MDQLHITMQGLEKRLQQIKEQYIQQKLTIEKLEQENKQLHHIIKVQKEKHLLLKDRAEPQPSIHLGLSGQESDAVKNRIKQYLQQIDQCIAFIEKL